VSPRTGAALKRDTPPDEEIRTRAEDLWDRGYRGDGEALWFRAKADLMNARLAVIRRLAHKMGRFPAHVHLDFAERFEVRKGAALAELDGDRLRLIAGRNPTLYVPPGVPHVNPYNEERDELKLMQAFEPPTEGARSYVETLAAMLADGRDEDGELPWQLIAAVADRTRERTYLTPMIGRAPRGGVWSYALQRRVVLPAGDAAAKLRRYHVHLEPSHGVRPKAGQRTTDPQRSEVAN
jgi:mannose-6-phosphate isomerase-like protein (cupin superfamily)